MWWVLYAVVSLITMAVIFHTIRKNQGYLDMGDLLLTPIVSMLPVMGQLVAFGLMAEHNGWESKEFFKVKK